MSSPSPTPDRGAQEFDQHSGPALAATGPSGVSQATSAGGPVGISGEEFVQQRKPSPPWVGAVMISGLALMAAILLTYTLADWKWQQDLGWWNYVATIALIPLVSVLMRLWEPDRHL